MELQMTNTKNFSGSKNFVAEYVDDHIWGLNPGSVSTMIISVDKLGVCSVHIVTEGSLGGTVETKVLNY